MFLERKHSNYSKNTTRLMTRARGRKVPVTQNIIELSLKSMFMRIDQLMKTVPEGCNLDKNPQYDHTIKDVWSIEEDWIVDKDFRRRMSHIHVDDD